MPRQAPKSLVPKIIVSLACLALFVGSTEADARSLFKRRLGFFESLFGAPRSAPRETIYGSNDNGDRPTWWEQQRRNKKNNIRTIYGYPDSQSRSANQRDYAEPEPLPGLGMGIVDYRPPIVSPVFDTAFIKLTASTPEAESIRLILSNGPTSIRAVDVERKAVLAFYKSNGFKPLWTSAGHVLPRAEALLKILANASVDGLVPKNYLPSTVGTFENVDQILANDELKIAKFDVDLTVQALKYARQLSGGQFEPNRLSLYNDIKPEPVDANSAVRVLAYTPYPENYLASLAPSNPQYAIFKNELSKLATASPKSDADLIAEGANIKPGKTDARIPQIRARLQVLGLLTANEAVNNNEQLLDKALSKGLKAFQKANKIKQTGALDSATVAAFNVDHRSDDRQRLVYNMERLRWLPKNLGSRYVLVNQAAFEVNVMDHGKSAWKSRVIVGRPLTQTYAFSDVIETVVFNPTWGVPASIIVNEYGPKSRKDSGYLDRNGFKVIAANGEVVSSRSINWFTFGQTPTFGVQQPAGDGNALGELKFLFPNGHDIYMHDTPTKNLFSESTRAFSHGCVRVQNPRDFAEVLLGWKQADINATIKTGESLPVNLKQKTPVHLTYFTAWTDSDGKIHYYDDIYGRDAAMAKAFAFGTTPKKPGSNDKTVENSEIIGGLTQN
jgi:L,D-transpeptidase YcbB